MAFLRRPATPATSTQETSQARVASRLLATALEGLNQQEGRFTVLDLGSGSAGNVEFFTGLERHARLVFCDCESLATAYAAWLATDPPPTFAQLIARFSRHLAIDPALKFDLILLWDHLHYFDLTAVEVLSTVLQPHIDDHTRGYGFGSLHNHQGINPYHYAIASEGEVFMRSSHTSALPFSHSQQALTEISFAYALLVARYCEKVI